MNDSLLLLQLKKETSSSFEVLYKSCFKSVETFIVKNNGTSQDAEDIFQESIIVLLQKVRQPDFVLTSSLKTFVFSISKNLWLKRIRDNKEVRTDVTRLKELINDDSYTDTNEIHIDTSNEHLVHTWMQKITEHCRQILNALYFYREPMETLIQKMGWKNKHTAANQKYKCLEQVKKQAIQ
jgi:RNA polymerase sigma factor (sigma-70 family)